MAEILTISQLLNDTDIGIDWDVPQDALGQGFKVSVADNITRFTFKLKYLTSISGTLTGYIYSDDGSGKPNTALATFSNMAANTLTTSFVDYDFTGTFTPTIATQYHAVLVWTGGSATDDIYWRIQVATNPYADGASSYRQTTWQGQANYDQYFKIYQTTSFISKVYFM